MLASASAGAGAWLHANGAALLHVSKKKGSKKVEKLLKTKMPFTLAANFTFNGKPIPVEQIPTFQEHLNAVVKRFDTSTSTRTTIAPAVSQPKDDRMVTGQNTTKHEERKP